MPTYQTAAAPKCERQPDLLAQYINCAGFRSEYLGTRDLPNGPIEPSLFRDRWSRLLVFFIRPDNRGPRA